MKPDDGKGESVSGQSVDDDYEMISKRCDGLSKARHLVERLDGERITTGALQKIFRMDGFGFHHDNRCAAGLAVS